MSAPQTRRIIRVDGTVVELPQAMSMAALRLAVGADSFDSVMLRHLGNSDWVMLVDDTGMCDGKPVNPEATKLYHANCRPGTTHPICGDVAVVLDGDFA